MAVPFAKINALVTAERQDMETRDIVSKVAKALVGKRAYSVMRDYDKRMENLHRSDAGSALLSCISDCPLDAELYIDICEPVSIWQVIRGVTPSGRFRNILNNLAKAKAMHRDSVVVFKVKHLGPWVAYNTADPYRTSTPRIVIPSSVPGQSSITVMPLTNYSAMWEAKRGEINDGWK